MDLQSTAVYARSSVEPSAVLTPYRTPPEPKCDEHEPSAAGALFIFVILLGVLVARFAPHNRSDDPEPRGHAAHLCSGQAHLGGHR
jgi:hypothetical protein